MYTTKKPGMPEMKFLGPETPSRTAMDASSWAKVSISARAGICELVLGEQHLEIFKIFRIRGGICLNS